MESPHASELSGRSSDDENNKAGNISTPPPTKIADDRAPLGRYATNRWSQITAKDESRQHTGSSYILEGPRRIRRRAERFHLNTGSSFRAPGAADSDRDSDRASDDEHDGAKEVGKHSADGDLELQPVVASSSTAPQRTDDGKALLRPSASTTRALLSAKPSWPLRIPACYMLIAFGAAVIAGSLAVGLYYSIAQDRMGDGFTTAGFMVAVGTLLLAAPMAKHYPKCRCWGVDEALLP